MDLAQKKGQHHGTSPATVSSLASTSASASAPATQEAPPPAPPADEAPKDPNALPTPEELAKAEAIAEEEKKKKRNLDRILWMLLEMCQNWRFLEPLL